MSAITTPLQPTSHAARTTHSALWAIPAGLVAGLVLGVIARVWMRLIAEDPSFSWSGTLFIVGAFGVFGLVHSWVWAARMRLWRRLPLTALRAVALVLTLPIFAGAGAIMFPVVVTASLAAWRTDWHRAVRIALGVLSAPLVLFVVVSVVQEFGFAPAITVRVGLFLAIYAVVLLAMQPAVAPVRDGWRVTRRVVIAGAVVVAAFVGFIGFLSVIGA